MLRRVGAATAVTLAALLAATGCSSGGDPSAATPSGAGTPPPPPTLASTPSMLAPDGQRLPIQQYLASMDQVAATSNATNLLASRCLETYGLKVTMPTVRAGADEAADTANLNRRYGLRDPKAAATDGYGRVGAPPKQPPVSPIVRGTPEYTVWTGSPDGGPPPASGAPRPKYTQNGKQVPEGGCLGEARRQLGATQPPQGAAQAINMDTYKRSQADTRVLAVFASWSACMKNKGFTYAKPTDVNDTAPFATMTKQDEIALAVADVGCKEQANVVGVWFAVDSAMQVQLIEEHQQELDETAKERDAFMKKITDVLAGKG